AGRFALAFALGRRRHVGRRVLVRGRRRRRDDLATCPAAAVVLDDGHGHARLAQEVAGARDADRLLVAIDLLLQLVDALLAALGGQARQRVEDRLVHREALLADRRQRLHRRQQQRQPLLRVAREPDGERRLLGARPRRVEQLLAVAAEVLVALVRDLHAVQRHREDALHLGLLVGQRLERRVRLLARDARQGDGGAGAQ